MKKSREYIEMIKDNDTGILSFLLISTLMLVIYYAKHFNLFSRRSIGSSRKDLLIVHVVTLGVSAAVILTIGSQIAGRVTGGLGLWEVGSARRWSPVHSSILEAEYSKFNVFGYSFLKYHTEAQSAEEFNCDTVEFADSLEATRPQAIDGDLKAIRKQAKKMSENEYPIAKLCFFETEGKTEKEILKNHWWNFCGSSVWLSKYQVHFYISRVVVSEKGERNKPTISLLHGEIYDREWKKLDGYQLPTLSNKVLKFPTLLKIRIDRNPRGQNTIQGCEDPRVILRKYKDSQGVIQEEPVVIFNMRSTSIRWFRAMHIYRPFTEETIRLTIKNRAPRFREKNWAPFFDENDNEHIYFVYNFNPLRVLKCTLDDGVCEKVAGPEFVDNKADESQHVSALRGGTDIVSIPNNMLPSSFKDREYWFGIARSHIEDCGCLTEIYRPHSFILSKDLKSDGFSLDYVSSVFDFNINPEPWNPAKKGCDDGKSVMIPNSIAFWETSKNLRTGTVSDIMAITLSEADRTNKIVHVKGFLQHILNALSDVQDSEKTGSKVDVHYNPHTVDVENAVLGKCSTDKASEYCELAEKTFDWSRESPLSEEESPLSEEESTLSKEEKPSSEEKRPSSEEKKPLSEEKKPSSEEKKPSSEEKRPSSEEKRPSSEEKRPSSEEGN